MSPSRLLSSLNESISFTARALRMPSLVRSWMRRSTFWITSTTPDTDIEVTITEVRPDGNEVYVQSGWLRASHRALGDRAVVAIVVALPEEVRRRYRAVGEAEAGVPEVVEGVEPIADHAELRRVGRRHLEDQHRGVAAGRQALDDEAAILAPSRNVVPDRVAFTVDVRDPRSETLDAMEAALGETEEEGSRGTDRRESAR